MSSFTRRLTVTKIIEPQEKKFLWFKYKGKKQYWIVDRPFQYFIGEENSSDVVSIPKDFITDFASIPRVFWLIARPDGIYTQAAVLHDFLASASTRTKKEIDLIFLEAMGVLGVPKWKQYSMYWALKYFGDKYGSDNRG